MRRSILAGLVFGFATVAAQASDSDNPFFHSSDPLAMRDELGLLHSSTQVYETDLARRYGWRPLYYLESGRDLMTQPAYVGALQAVLHRYGYYCGPIDGMSSAELSDAIAHMQKNYSMRVTGTLTVPVRRALHLP